MKFKRQSFQVASFHIKVEFLERNSHLVFVPGLGHNDPIRNLSKDQFQYGAARRCNVSTCVKWKVTKATKVEHHPAQFGSEDQLSHSAILAPRQP